MMEGTTEANLTFVRGWVKAKTAKHLKKPSLELAMILFLLRLLDKGEG